MVRTRRQAAHQPQASSDPPSSGEDSDIPGKAGVRPKPGDVSTLRPSRKEPPPVLLSTSKRGSTAAQLGSKNLSEHKKRRIGSGVTSNRSKHGNRSNSDGVNPIALSVLNTYHHKARSTLGTRSPHMPGLTVEIHRRSARSSNLKTVPENGVDEELNSEAGGDQPEEEMEQEPPSNQMNHGSPSVEEPDNDNASPDPVAELPKASAHGVEQSRAHSARSKAGEMKPHGNSDPPRSGQGDLPRAGTWQEAPSQRITRSSQIRRPKLGFYDRPSAEVGAPKTSQQPRGSASREKTSSGTAPSQKILRNGHVSFRPDATQESILVPDGSSSESEADDEDGREEPSSHGPARDSLFHQAPPAPDGQLTVHVPSKEVGSMYRLMGRKGWTAYGTSWATDLSDPRTLKNTGRPASQMGVKLHKHLVVLTKIYRQVPSVRDAARQSKFLQDKSDSTAKAFVEIERLVNKVREEFLAPLEAGYDAADNKVRRRNVLRQDLTQCIIPLLVLLLREFFFLGCSSVDAADDDRELPEEGGSFTSTTLQLLVRTAGFIARLAQIIRIATEVTGAQPPSTDKNEDEPPRSSSGTKVTGAHQKARHRIGLARSADRFMVIIHQALRKLEADASRETRRKELMERAANLQAEKEHEEQEALEKSQRRWEAVCLSTQSLRSGPGPVSLMWLNSQALAEKRTAERERHLAEMAQMGSPQLGGFFDGSPARPSRRAPLEPTLLSPQLGKAAAVENRVSTATKWQTEESRWLLSELKAGRAPEYDTWAETLGRRVDEVRQEAHLLKVSARTLAAEKGYRVPAWARK